MLIIVHYNLTPTGQRAAAAASLPAARGRSLVIPSEASEYARALPLARIDVTGQIVLNVRREYDEIPTVEALLLAAEEESDRRAAYVAQRAVWIAQFGSPHLRRCVVEGVECDRFYRNEWLRLTHPDWTWIDGTDLRPARNPPPYAFTVLEEARVQRATAVLRFDGDTGGYAVVDTAMDKLIRYAPRSAAAHRLHNCHRGPLTDGDRDVG